jgi:hypothetical protein
MRAGIVGLMLLLSTASACRGDSTLTCPGTLFINIASSSGDAPFVGVVLDLNLDGRKVTCDPKWSYTTTDMHFLCAGGTILMEYGTHSTCSEIDAGAVICTDDKGMQLILAIASAPATVDLKLTQSGQLVGQTTLQPSYDETRPNGPNTEPVCRAGTVTWMLD